MVIIYHFEILLLAKNKVSNIFNILSLTLFCTEIVFYFQSPIWCVDISRNILYTHTQLSTPPHRWQSKWLWLMGIDYEEQACKPSYR